MRPAPLAPSWFKIKQYAPAVRFGFREWATHIGNRIFLGQLLDAGKLAEFDQRFNPIMSDPFVDLGFSASFPADKTVYPLTFGVAKAITDLLSDANSGDNDFCDEKLHELHPDIYAGQAHLFVNLRAPKTLLIKQFSDWLETARLERKRDPAITNSVTQTWAVNHPILPYEDLRLWHKRQERKLPSDSDMAYWLDLNDKEAARRAREKAELAFTLDYYFDLIFSASDSESTETSPPSA